MVVIHLCKGMATLVSSLMKLSNTNLIQHIQDCPGCRGLDILLLKPLQSAAACDWTKMTKEMGDKNESMVAFLFQLVTQNISFHYISYACHASGVNTKLILFADLCLWNVTICHQVELFQYLTRTS